MDQQHINTMKVMLLYDAERYMCHHYRSTAVLGNSLNRKTHMEVDSSLDSSQSYFYWNAGDRHVQVFFCFSTIRSDLLFRGLEEELKITVLIG